MTTGEYNVCVDSYTDNVYRFALKSLRNSDAAKDVVQESFLRLWENRHNVIEGKEKSYLFTIAYRLIVDNVRSNSRYTGDEKIATLRNSDNGGYNNISEILSSAIDTLPDLQKNLILLRDYDGYSYKEIGDMTNLSEAQVKVYIFRARATLKSKLVSIENII